MTGDALLDALEESEQAHLIVPTPGREPRWEFSHALIRQTLTANLSLPRRQRLHLKVADAIERAAGDVPENHASDLAHHLYQAGSAADPQKTVRYMRIAGERGLEAGAGEEALRQFQNALDLLEGDQLAERATLLSHKGRALNIVGRTDEALAGRRDEAAALHPLTVRAIDTGTLVEFFSTTMPHLSVGIAAACGEQWDAAEDHYRTGLHHAHALPHRMLQPELRRWYARMLVDRSRPGDRDKARDVLGEAVEMYQTIGMPRHVEMAKELMKQL